MKDNDVVLTSEQQRSYRLIMLNGACIMCAFAFVSSSVVLPAFVFKLTASTALVGLVSSIQGAGWLWPQMVISNLVEHRERKKPFYLWPGIVRILTWGLVVAITLLIPPDRPLLLFWIFILLLAINASCSGISGVPFMDIVSKAIPRKRRTRLFSRRKVGGGLLGILAGFVVWYIMSDATGLTFPHNYAVLFALAMIFSALSIITFLMVREPIEPVNEQRTPFRHHLKSGPKLLKRDKDYRALLVCRAFWSLGMMSIPFVIPYAIHTFEISQAMTGPFLSAGAISALFATYTCGRIGERYGDRAMLLSSVGVLAFAPLAAMLVKYVPPVKPPSVLGISIGLDLRSLALFVPFVINAWGTSGIMIGNMTYLMAIAPSKIRPTYIGFMNTFVFPLTFVPFLAGKLLNYVSYEVIFALAIFFSLIATGAVWRLSEPTEEEVERRGDILKEGVDTSKGERVEIDRGTANAAGS